MKIIPAVEARIHLGEIMKRAYKKGERFTVEKSGIPMVVILPAHEYESLIQEHEERFKILDRIQSQLPSLSEKEVSEDVQNAIQTVRKSRA